MAEQAAVLDNPADVAEAAKYAAMEKEFKDFANDDDAPAEKAEPAPVEKAEPEPKVEAKKDEEKAPQPYEVLEKNYKNLQGALGESRHEARALRERQEASERQLQALQEFIKTKVAPQEDVYRSPEEILAEQVRGLEHQNRQTAQQLEQMQRQTQEQREIQELGQRAIREEQEFQARTPDYIEAANHLQQARLAELSLLWPDNSPVALDGAQRAGFNTVADYRMAMMRQEQVGLARRAFGMQTNVAEVIYGLAKTRGYTPKAAAAPVAQKAPIETVRAGAKASGSLSGGGGSAPAANETSVEELTQMFIDDPEQAERMWSKMKKQGLLG